MTLKWHFKYCALGNKKCTVCVMKLVSFELVIKISNLVIEKKEEKNLVF